ncbi:phage tail tube protein [Streptomyces shenzhenensis]|uniref:Outer capsid protein Hoc n=1 Tax=Streptomyces shenzhenensis TaxID=943815 RepID=A0A3M0HYK2_9ACTN|nr:phage tail tube protein [Streptomyces shenzhenensis]RMB81278.1 outer capsid protein Hoc [Streptomyces shenzhenensis]
MAGMDGFGVQLKRGDGQSPEVFTKIADVTSLNPPGISRETLDVTSHDSVNAWMEFLGGLKDPGEVSADVNYQPSKHDLLVADFEDDAPRNYQIVFPDEDATTWAFPAILTGFEPEAPYDDKATASLTWKVSGKPTITPGA